MGCESPSKLLRRCDRKTLIGAAAECIFSTLGGKQVGSGTIVGWRDVIAPELEHVSIWPFDGDLQPLLGQPGITIAEIYLGEAYSHLGICIGTGTGRRKTSHSDRQAASRHLLGRFASGVIQFSRAAKSWVEWGFPREDDFDAMVRLLSMLLVVTGQCS